MSSIIKLTPTIRKQALKQLQDEINDHTIYTYLAHKSEDENNRKIFQKLAAEERNHYDFCQMLTGETRRPNRLIIAFIKLMVGLLGVLFTLKFMESRELNGKSFYLSLFDAYPQAKIIYQQEVHHEIALIDMLHDKKITYAGAIVLGMNDALVELTGTLTGIALAFEQAKMVGITGFIMGVAASLSMAGSAYLESNENKNELNGVKPLVYSLYTGIAYIITTLMLILPFFLFQSIPYALIVMFIFALLAILGYNFYISVAKGSGFIKRVSQMLIITFGVALISFLLGYGVKYFFGIDI